MSISFIVALLMLEPGSAFIYPNYERWPHSITRQKPVCRTSTGSDDNVEPENITTRRFFVSGLAAASWYSVLINPVRASDDIPQQQQKQGLVSTEQLAGLLRAVPTFAIVDPKGVPYMVVGEDAKVTGYFFTEFDEANRILKLARESANKAIAAAKKDPGTPKDEEFVNPWLEARISSVPLDFAVTLVTKSLFGSGGVGGSYFQVAPSEANVEDALAISKKDDLEEGKVPLFYLEDFEISNGQTPLYFSKQQLIKAFRKEQKATPTNIKVTELFAVLLEMVRPDGTDTDLQTLVFIPPIESEKRAKECQKAGGDESSYLLGQRNVVL